MLLKGVMAITVVMGGLLTHVGDDAASRNHLVVVDDREHISAILVEKDSVEGPNARDYLIRLQKDDFISFDGLITGDAEVTFTGGVPSLQKFLIGGPLDDAVRYAKDHNEVGAYMQYPKGKLYIDTWHKDQAKVKINGQEEQFCVAKTVRFEADPAPGQGKVVLRVDNRSNGSGANAKNSVKIPLTPTAKVYLFNVALSHAHPGHFSKYAHLASKATGIHPIERGSPCSKRTASTTSVEGAIRATSMLSLLEALIASHPECTNSSWP